MSRPIPVLARAALAAGAVLVTVGALEVPAVLGLLDWSRLLGTAVRVGRDRPWLNPLNRPDSQLLWMHRGGAAWRGAAAGDLVDLLGIPAARRYPVDVRYDARGFRNAAWPDSARLALIGDSFLEWPLVADSDLAARRLAGTLGVPVANLGHAGYGPMHEIVVLRRFALPLRPRAVLWFLFEGNDLSDVATWRELTRDWPLTSGRSGGFRERSFVVNALRVARWARDARRPAPDLAERRRCVMEIGGTPDTTWFYYAGAPLGAVDLRRLAVVDSLLALGAREARAAGAELAVVFVPSKFRVLREACRERGADVATWSPSDLPGRVEALARAGGLPFLDLTAALRSAAAGGTPYFGDDGHWNARGNRAVADTLAAFARARGWAGP